MPLLRRNTALSFLAFVIVLMIAILCQPYTATLYQKYQKIEYTGDNEYGDSKLSSSILNSAEA